jgi:hypothetical protein
VSHFKEREHTNCLNCGAEVQGRFCHICGQENIEPKESVWHLINHFFQDITHFHGKFFSTLKYLLLKPGFLSREYRMGRRTSYLNPIRMYVFTSAIFFLFFFSMVDTNGVGAPSLQYKTAKQLEALDTAVGDLQARLAVTDFDSTQRPATAAVLQRFKIQQAALKAKLSDIKQKDSLRLAKYRAKQDSVQMVQARYRDISKREVAKAGDWSFTMNDLTDFKTLMAYDSVQAQLPPDKRDGWWVRLWARKGIDVYQRANDRSGNYSRQLLDKFFHSLPQMFFLSLPLYAFFLLLLYKRHKQYYYVNHAIFSIHVFCATFIMTMVFILLVKYLTFGSDTVNSVWNWIFFLSFMFYQYRAMRSFYQQKRGKTLLKLGLLSVASFLVSFVLTVFFLIISLWKV